MESEASDIREGNRRRNKFNTVGLGKISLDIIPDDSVSIIDRPILRPTDVRPIREEHSAISADSSVVGKVNPVMGNFYQERERIRRKQAERLRRANGNQ